jgi:hypothetical protein
MATIKAISNHLTKHGIPHTHHHPPHADPHITTINSILIQQFGNTITTTHYLKSVRPNLTLYIADPDLFAKILKVLQ